jgi:hypothetical protein
VTGNTRIRTHLPIGTGIATLALPILAAGSAAATPQIPGDNGDVKIHVVGALFPESDNDPHVCKFYLDAFNFDVLQQVTWTIEDQPPTGAAGKVALSGAITLTSGIGHTADLSLPDGHYKLEWNFVGEHGAAKQKVFWVDCGSSPGDGATGGAIGGTIGGTIGGGTTGGTTGGGTTGGGTSGGTGGSTGGGTGRSSGGSSSSPGSTPSSHAPSTSTPVEGVSTTPVASTTGGGLAHTGADGLVVLAAGALLAGGGGFALRRYAVKRQH